MKSLEGAHVLMIRDANDEPTGEFWGECGLCGDLYPVTENDLEVVAWADEHECGR